MTVVCAVCFMRVAYFLLSCPPLANQRPPSFGKRIHLTIGSLAPAPSGCAPCRQVPPEYPPHSASASRSFPNVPLASRRQINVQRQHVALRRADPNGVPANV